jgi:IS30 family transposase
MDNGREHHRHMALRFLGMKTYFADPYSSWQRGTNENTNGLIRKYCPKQTSFKNLSQEDLGDIVGEINDRPRKCLGYNTPREEFEKQLGCCT